MVASRCESGSKLADGSLCAPTPVTPWVPVGEPQDPQWTALPLPLRQVARVSRQQPRSVDMSGAYIDKA